MLSPYGHDAQNAPHAEATYRVVPSENGSAEVTIPESSPTKVSPFATEADAEAWITRHQGQVQTQAPADGSVAAAGRAVRGLTQPFT